MLHSVLLTPSSTHLTQSQSELLLACSKALKTAVNEKRAGKEGAHMARMYLAFGARRGGARQPLRLVHVWQAS